MDLVLDEKTCQELLELIDDLQLPEWPLERKITREQAKTRIANFLDLDPEDPKLLEKALEKINQIFAGELKIESVPKNLDELVKEYEEHQEKLEEQRKAFLKRTYPTLSEQIRNALQTKHAHDLLLQLKESEKQLAEEERILTQNPKRAERAGEQIAGLLAQNLPQTARVEALTKEDYQEVLKKAQPEIKQILERVGVTQPEKTIQIFIDQAVKKDLPLAQEVAATPRSYEKEVPPPSPRKEYKPEELVLPSAIASELAAEPDSTAFAHSFIAHPRVATGLGARILATPPVEAIKFSARISGEISPFEREIIFKGLKAGDVQKSIRILKEKGLPDDHPVMRGLLLDSHELQRFADAHPFMRRVFDAYYRYPRLTGRVQTYSPSAGIYLPVTEPGPIWEKKKGLAWNFRRSLNLVGEKSGFYQITRLVPEKTIVQPALPNLIVRAISLGKIPSTQALRSKITSPIIGFLRKTPLKKAATWFLGKLGLSAAGTAFAPGVGTAISVALSAVLEIGGKILGKIWDTIKSIIRDPEKSLVALIGGITLVALFSHSILLVIIGVGAAGIGGMGVISLGAASAGAIASGFAANVVAFFTAVATLPITAPIALFIVGIISTIATITFFIVMTTAGAFILPIAPVPTISTYLKVTKNVNRNEIPNDELPNSPCVTYTVNVSAQQPIIITSVTDERTVVCIGSTPKVETPVNISHPTDPITSWTSGSYELCFDSSFADCRVCNTVTVVANVVDGPTGQMASDTTCVDIGSPPEDCPQGWPTEHGYITQGPNANYSHPGQEAIDIGVPIGTPVKSTHEGDVVEATWGTSVVKVRGTCNSKMFVTDYIHLQNKAVRTGDHIYRDDLIGTSGTGGTGSHLHYEFVGLEMASPYIPIRDDILEGCCLRVPLCSKNCYDPDIYTKW